MKLALIRADGTLEIVTEDIETYDLTKPLAAASVVEEIHEAVVRAIKQSVGV